MLFLGLANKIQLLHVVNYSFGRFVLLKIPFIDNVAMIWRFWPWILALMCQNAFKFGIFFSSPLIKSFPFNELWITL